MDSNLLKEAIADAKAVRQTALANAKVALEEAFSERYHAMFAEKLKEEATMEEAPKAEAESVKPTEEPVSTQEIDELIKELEAEVGGEQPLAEPDADDIGAVPPVAPVAGAVTTPGAPVPPVATVAPGAEVPIAPGAEVPLAPAPTAGAGVPPAPVAPTAPEAPVKGGPSTPPSDVPPAPEETDEDVDLDALLESLKEEIGEEKEEKEEEKKLDEDKKLSSSGIGGNKAGGSDNKKPSTSASASSHVESGGCKDHGVPEGKSVTKDATEASRPNEGSNATSTNQSTPSMGGQSGPALKASRPNSKGDFENTTKINEENETLKKQLNEAEEVIKYVKTQLNEVNLLNAKLLYTNKLFKEYNMNNEQKMRVVEMFDLAKNVREVKLTYANIAESLNFSGTEKKKTAPAASSVQSITEGLASKPVGGTKPSTQIISESKASGMVSKFQKLAGIKRV